MAKAREDDEIAFTVKIFAFDKLTHCNSFIAPALYRGLRLIGDPSYRDGRRGSKSRFTSAGGRHVKMWGGLAVFEK